MDMNNMHEHEVLRHALATELIAGHVVAEWQGRHGLHGAVVLPDGRIVVCTAYHSYADFTAHQDWPPEVIEAVGEAMHMHG